jgi:hypothetical protein
MTLDPMQPRSRRGILAAAGAAVAALAANAIGGPRVASAATGDNVVAGDANEADAVTSLQNTTADEVGLSVVAAGLGAAVAGASPRGNGVLGLTGTTTPSGQTGSDSGVFGRGIGADAFAGVEGDSDDGYGVSGTSGTVGVVGAGGLVGVMGQSFDLTGTSVYAVSSGFPPPAPLPNTALHARRSVTSGGYAAYVDGRLRLRMSGRATIAAGTSSKAISVTGLTSGMMAFAMLQTSEPGTWVRTTAPSTGILRIYLNKALSTSAVVAWMIIG